MYLESPGKTSEVVVYNQMLVICKDKPDHSKSLYFILFNHLSEMSKESVKLDNSIMNISLILSGVFVFVFMFYLLIYTEHKWFGA